VEVGIVGYNKTDSLKIYREDEGAMWLRIVKRSGVFVL
jgi:hypothetical protein